MENTDLSKPLDPDRAHQMYYNPPVCEEDSTDGNEEIEILWLQDHSLVIPKRIGRILAIDDSLLLVY